MYLRRYNVRVQSTLEYGSTKVRRYLTRTSYKRILYFRSTEVLRSTFVLSKYSSYTYERTKVLSYESTKVLSYESTKVLSYFRKYFRKYDTCTRTRTCTVLPEVRVHLQPPVRHSPSTFNILALIGSAVFRGSRASPRPPGDAFASNESKGAGRVRKPGVGAAARAGARSRARDGARARAHAPY